MGTKAQILRDDIIRLLVNIDSVNKLEEVKRAISPQDTLPQSKEFGCVSEEELKQILIEQQNNPDYITHNDFLKEIDKWK